MEYPDKGLGCLHGNINHSKSLERAKLLDCTAETDKKDLKTSVFDWKANEKSSIPCPSDDLGGCGITNP